MSASLQQDDDRVIYALIRSMYDADGAVPSRPEWERLRRPRPRRAVHPGARVAICLGALAVTVISTGRPSPAPVAREPVAAAVPQTQMQPGAAVVADVPAQAVRADPVPVRHWRARPRIRRAVAARADMPAVAATVPVPAVAVPPVATADNRRPMTVASVRSTLPVQESDRPSGEDDSHDANPAPSRPDAREKEALDAIRTLRLR